MTHWELVDELERGVRLLQVINELIALLQQERKHIVAVEHKPLTLIHMRKIELVQELTELRRPEPQGEVAVYVQTSQDSLLREQITTAARRLEIEARMNALLCGDATSAIAQRLGYTPEDTGTYDGKARRSMNIPSRSRRAA